MCSVDRRSCGMEKILELRDSQNSTYPEHFQIFLDNCARKFSEKFAANDYLFAAVYFLILETGFVPQEFTDVTDYSDSATFDIRRLRRVTSYSDGHVKISHKSQYLFYQIILKLGSYSSSTCELQGVPSAEVNTHLIINFLCKEPHLIKSVCLNTEKFVEKNKKPSQHKYLLKNMKDLSLIIKNNIAIHLKDVIQTNEEEGCSANLLCLPEEIQKKIIYSLKDDPASIQCLSSTCSYFYSFISKDSKLWEEICFQEYGGWILNKVLQETSIVGDTNVFRTAFLNLKAKDSIRYDNQITIHFLRLLLEAVTKKIKIK